jgi:type I restriction enzyme S subunit
MQSLLARGIDKHRSIRSEKTHEFKNSPVGRIPVQWNCDCLDELLLAKQYGTSSALNDEPIGIPILRMNNLVDGFVETDALKYLAGVDLTRLLLNDGDLLFNRTNSIDYVGRTGLFRDVGYPISFASYLVRLVADGTIVLPEFLNWCLNHEPYQIKIKSMATIGVQQANVNPTNLGTLPLAYPVDIDEQSRISEVLYSAVGSIERQKRLIAKLNAIQTGLMQDLLSKPMLEREIIQDVKGAVGAAG